MKISSKREFHSVVGSLRSLLADEGVAIKTTRTQELLSQSLGYKSANGLLASLPVDIELNDAVFRNFDDRLSSNHAVSSVDSFTGSARPIWTADIASDEFENHATKLEKEFGEMPDKEQMFSRPD